MNYQQSGKRNPLRRLVDCDIEAGTSHEAESFKRDAAAADDDDDDDLMILVGVMCSVNR
jgi:hypothetical protein